MPTHNTTWDSNNFDQKPSGDSLLGMVWSFIRATRQAVRERFQVEHNFDLANGDNQGGHKQGSARVWVSETAPVSPIPPYATMETDLLTGRVRVNPVTGQVFVHNGTLWVELTGAAATAYKIAVRGSDGTVKTAAPTADADATTKAYVDAAIAAVTANIAATASKLIPVGFLYAQLPGQPAPDDIYADFGWTWSDVTSTYEGAFFRAAGGLAEPFETDILDVPAAVQLDAMQTMSGHFYTDNFSSADGSLFKDGGQAVDKGADGKGYGRRIDFAPAEVVRMADETRPRNYTMLLWKRTS